MILRCSLFWTFWFCIQFVSSEDGTLKTNSRLADINGNEEWVNELGHYRIIQDCVVEANDGDMCIIRP